MEGGIGIQGAPGRDAGGEAVRGGIWRRRQVPISSQRLDTTTNEDAVTRGTGLHWLRWWSYILPMSSVAEIEQAIAKLPPGEFVELERWFDAERNRQWDRQIEEDAQSGKLRELYERLQAEDQGQSNVPLDEFLDHEKLS
jgi:hypothetical protein